MKKLSILFGVLITIGCQIENEGYQKIEQQRFCSDDQKKLLISMHATTLSGMRALAGDDQDWDDAVSAATYSEMKAMCSLYEITYHCGDTRSCKMTSKQLIQ